MVGFTDNETGFGLMRALNRVRSGKRVSRIIEGVQLKDTETSRPASGDGMGASQIAQKQQARDQHNGLELWPLPGLAPMTRVRTSFGDVHAIALRKGDKVLLKSGEYKAIEWVNRIMLEEHILNLKPDSNPILLAPGSLGPNVPSSEMMVSPRQIFCADDRSGLSKPREASMLLSRTGVRRFRETGLTYTMFHVGEAADVYCEGAYLHFPIET